MVDPTRTINRRRVGALVIIIGLGVALLAICVMAAASMSPLRALGGVAPVALACSSVVADRLDVLQGGSGWLAVGTGGKDQ